MKSTIKNQINNITANLIAVGLSIDQNFPSDNDGSVYISGNKDLSVALKNISYQEIYEILEKDKNYNIKMIDGALIQLMYEFDGDELKKYRLAFFPSPNLEEFQNNSEIYEMDQLYADVLNKNIVTTPIRFDYDPSNYTTVEHPKSHLTIGQYKNCRIPINTPITPYIFMDFILRNFYNTTHTNFSTKLNFDKTILFDNCIHEDEEKILHIAIH